MRVFTLLIFIFMASCPSILQWNARSITSKLAELQYYFSSQPVPILAISECRLRPGSRTQPYVHYPSAAATPNSSSRASLFVHSSVQQAAEDVSHLCTQTAEFAACIVIFGSFKMTIVSVYICPTGRFDANCISSLRLQFPGRLPICGDFNAHHPLRGSKHTTPRGTTLADEIESTYLIIVNDGSPTCFGHRGEPSALDLTLASPNLDVYWSLNADTWKRSSSNFDEYTRSDPPPTSSIQCNQLGRISRKFSLS